MPVRCPTAPHRWNRLWRVAFVLFLPVFAAAQPARQPTAASAEAGSRLSAERTGRLSIRPGQWLRLRTDLGSIRVVPQDSHAVEYRVLLETEAGPAAAERLQRVHLAAQTASDGVQITSTVPGREFRGRLWARFEIRVPRECNLDLVTQAGNVEIADVAGEIRVSTGGGNISLGAVRGPARLETRGGHITARSISADLTATTAGGHIRVSSVGGAAVLRSAGGHISAGQIDGPAEVETGGGNITLTRAGSTVTAVTAGGQIDFGQAAGAITARTGGGGIRVLQIRAPAQVKTSAGSIQLLQVGAPVRASTEAGGITAFFLPGGKLQEASELFSERGDIVVYLPRDLSLTIDALVEGVLHPVVIAPDLPLDLRYLESDTPRRALRARGHLNGGGQPLRLRTAGGRIRLQYTDTLNPLDDQRFRNQLEELQQQLERQAQQARRQAELLHRTLEQQQVHRLESLHQQVLYRLRGYVRIPASEQMKKLISSVRPVYPPTARQSGIQGTVRMEVLIGKDGRVETVKVLSGPSLLIEAAREAVRQWRYVPTWLSDEPVPVLTTVDMEFRLN
jgi:TonB family protein